LYEVPVRTIYGFPGTPAVAVVRASPAVKSQGLFMATTARLKKPGPIHG
jgi:hypothetical protein